MPARARVAERWTDLRRLRDAFSRASMDARERSARLEWLAFQIAEFDAVQPRDGEDDALLAEKQVLLHADRVQRLCREGYDLLVEQEGSALSTLGGVWKRVDELAQIGDGFAPFADGRARRGRFSRRPRRGRFGRPGKRWKTPAIAWPASRIGWPGWIG